MKHSYPLALAALAMAPLTACAASPAQPYLGRWDVTLQTPERAWSSWLDVREEHGQPRVRMVGRWGHARWLPQASIVDGHLRFVSPAAEEGRADDMVFDGVRVGDELQGTTRGRTAPPGPGAPSARPRSRPHANRAGASRSACSAGATFMRGSL